MHPAHLSLSSALHSSAARVLSQCGKNKNPLMADWRQLLLCGARLGGHLRVGGARRMQLVPSGVVVHLGALQHCCPAVCGCVPPPAVVAASTGVSRSSSSCSSARGTNKQTNNSTTHFDFEVELLHNNGYAVAIRAIGTLNCLVTGSPNSIGAPLAGQALGTPAFHTHTRAHTPGLLDSSLARRSSIQRLS